jgi:hypothetical protein
MLTLEFSLNILILAGIVIISVLAGFSLRGRQVTKSRQKIVALEREMLSNYAEILELQKDYLHMESKLRDFQIPVIPIKSVVKDVLEENQKLPEISLRKKLLIKESLLHHSFATK